MIKIEQELYSCYVVGSKDTTILIRYCVYEKENLRYLTAFYHNDTDIFSILWSHFSRLKN